MARQQSGGEGQLHCPRHQPCPADGTTMPGSRHEPRMLHDRQDALNAIALSLCPLVAGTHGWVCRITCAVKSTCVPGCQATCGLEGPPLDPSVAVCPALPSKLQCPLLLLRGAKRLALGLVLLLGVEKGLCHVAPPPILNQRCCQQTTGPAGGGGTHGVYRVRGPPKCEMPGPGGPASTLGEPPCLWGLGFPICKAQGWTRGSAGSPEPFLA